MKAKYENNLAAIKLSKTLMHIFVFSQSVYEGVFSIVIAKIDLLGSVQISNSLLCVK